MRLIDADALGEAVKEKVGLETGIGREINDGMIVAYAMIAMAPTITLDDLRPHGRWVKGENGEPVCGVCGSDPAAGYDEEPWETPFCPFCGAELEEAEK